MEQVDPTQKRAILAETVMHLRSELTARGFLSTAAIQEQMRNLELIGYGYDIWLFPQLPGSGHDWGSPSGKSPQTLAEALLWKMGKWKVYESFVRHQRGISDGPGDTDVVFYAFAQHLRDPSKEPIYDQHALRGLWAIVPDDHRARFDEVCEPVLVNSKGGAAGAWKDTGSGRRVRDAYELYVSTVKGLALRGCQLGPLDKLLMPLGQALKQQTMSVTDFRKLCSMT